MTEPKAPRTGVERWLLRSPYLLSAALVVGFTLRVLAPEVHNAFCTVV